MFKHRPSGFGQYVVRDDDPEVRLNSVEVSIKGSMMQLAEADSIRDAWLAVGIGVRDDVRGIEEFGVFEMADGTMFSVGA